MIHKYPKLLFLSVIFFAAAVVLGISSALQPSGKLKVSFLNIGQGDSILVVSPTGGKMIIDGGSSRKILSELGKALHFYERDIDIVVGTHPDKDHIGGLFHLMDSYKTGVFIDPGSHSATDFDELLRKKAGDLKIPYVIGKAGMRIDLGGGANFYVLYPDRDVSKVKETNETSIVGVLIYGGKRFLFTGDAPKDVEDYLTFKNSGILRADVLKVGHHGSKTSTSPVFLSAVKPAVAVISVGEGNQYHHPNEEVLNLMQKLKIPLFRTDKNGRITTAVENETLKTETEDQN